MSLRNSILIGCKSFAVAVGLLISLSSASGQTVAAAAPVVSALEQEPEVSEKAVGKVSFTFDCAQWGDKGLDHILEVMERREITGTFFVTGKFVETNKEGILKIAEAGHEVANHSYEHDKKNSIAECDKVARLYKEATGKTMSGYFRAPYLYEKGISWSTYAKNGWKEGYVSLITCDALPEYKRISDRVFLNNFRHYVTHGSDDRIAIHKTPFRKGPGHINGAAILMHIDGYRFHLLEQMVDIVERTGYQCSTFSEAYAARGMDDWTLDPQKSGEFPPPPTMSTAPKKSNEPPAYIRLAEARPDETKVEAARQALSEYTPEAVEDRGQFSFTFNCHRYNREGLGTILVVLRETKTPATFYVSERYLLQVPGAVRQILEHGHEIAYFSASDDGSKTLTDAEKFAKFFEQETGQTLVRLFREPWVEGREPVDNNYAITNWANGYQTLIAADNDEKFATVKDGSFLAYFKIYLSIAPKVQVSIMKVPYSGTGNIDGGVVAMHPNGNRYHLLKQMIGGVRDKGYSLVRQSELKNKRL